MKYRFIDTHRHSYAVKALCQALKVSTSGYYAARSRPPFVAPVLILPAIGRCQRLTDHHALHRPGQAFPVGFDSSFPGQVTPEQNQWMWKFLPVVAWLGNRAVAGGRAGIQPAQTAHLLGAEQIAAARGKVVRQRTGKKSQSIQLGHAGQSSLCLLYTSDAADE